MRIKTISQKNNYLIRKANIKDLRDILRLNFYLFKKEHKEYDKTLNLRWTYLEGIKYFKDRILKRTGFVEVAEINGKIIGYLSGGFSERLFYRKKINYAEAENMFIEDKFRNIGIGTKLMKDFINWSKKNKINYISVIAFAKNEQSINFSRKLGFKDYNLVLEMKIK